MTFSGNAFLGNRTQVRYTGTRWLEWSEEGRGNYWSDHVAFDIDGDARADSPYRPNDLIDKVVWQQPMAALLVGAPAVQLIRWSQDRFPGLLPGGRHRQPPDDQPRRRRRGEDAMTHVIEARGLAVRFGRTEALRDLTLAVEPGERVALLGHNGAGKSTFFKVILGFLQPTAGVVRVMDHAPGSVAARQAVSYLPEQVAFARGLTGTEVMDYFARLRGADRGANAALLSCVGLPDPADRAAGQL